MELTVGGARGFTVMVKLWDALKGGEPLSVTFMVIVLVVLAWLTSGRQVKTALVPLLVVRVALAGAPIKLKVKVCDGASGSKAELVVTRVAPALMAWSGMAVRIGGELDACARPAKVT